MVDVAQDIVVTEEDCQTENFRYVQKIEPNIEPLFERLVGRYAGKDVYDSAGNLLVERDQLFTEKLAKAVANKVDRVPVRTLLSCNTKRGVCRKCYGLDLSSRHDVELGEAVGVIAAQSIGEPGTQLTMRTFHTGGVAGDDITQGLPRIQEIFEARRTPKGEAVLTEFAGTAEIRDNGRIKEVTVYGDNGENKTYPIPYGYNVRIEEGEHVEIGDTLTQGSINPHKLLVLKGLEAVQEYLVSEVQSVYRRQGVKINDKHIEVIIRQMTRKVVVKESGGSNIVPGRVVDRYKLHDINKRLKEEGKEEVVVNDILLGISDASKSTDSFLSAASFQETPKALTTAAVNGKKDNLSGLKESIITGKRIPAGTGFYDNQQ